MIAAYTPPDDHAGTGPRGAPAPAAGAARRTERKPMNPRPYPHSSDPATGSRALRPVLGALCCLLLGWGSTLPANAESGTISGPRTGTITVKAGETLNIVDGAQLSGGYDGVDVVGGTLNISGGSISASYIAVLADGGTVNISGGSISGEFGVDVVGGGTASITVGSISATSGGIGVFLETSGTVNISGGSISGGQRDISQNPGYSTSVYGCGLTLDASGRLTGTLQDGTAINASTGGLSASDLQNAPPQITCPPSVSVASEPGLCGAHVTATASATACGATVSVSGARSDGQALTALYPPGTTTITWTATNAAGQATCTQTVTVRDTAGPTISGLSATPTQLWAPNHKLVDVAVSYTGSDNCGGALTWVLSATSSEPDSGLGTDDVAGDIQILDSHHLKVRAERYSKQGRVYTITVTGTDASGNRSQQTVTVTVPH
jgi:hypothetical protein